MGQEHPDRRRPAGPKHAASLLAAPFVVALLLVVPPLVPGAQAQLGDLELPDVENVDLEQPTLISADEISYDEGLGVVTAGGNVEISQGPRVLLADTVTYNLRSEIVTASGNISLLEPTGEVLFAEYVELTDDLREGFIREIRVLLTDGTRMAASSGQRTGGNRSSLNNAVFSPCDLCRDDPSRPPLWQLRADRVVHDQEDQVVRYRNARMEFYGVPVAYTPYFEHPDPTVGRQSGLLAPGFGSEDFLGTFVDIPYYWNIAPERDATLTAKATTKQGVQLTGEFRSLFQNGELDATVSGTVSDRRRKDNSLNEDEFRGHVDAIGRFEFTRTWRGGFDALRATDDTYLRTYGINNDARLTSNVFVEGLHGRNYLAANAFAYQTVRRNESTQQQPIVAPMFDINYMGEPGVAGGYYTFDGNLMVLSRRRGRASRRLSGVTGWTLPYTAPAGDVYSLRAQIQTDAYWTDDVDAGSPSVDPNGKHEEDFEGRVFPQIALQWRYPFVARHEGLTQGLEPAVQGVLSAGGTNTGAIPNEDSRDLEFDDTNLFSLNRFPGRDRVDQSPRVDYGLRYVLASDEGFYSQAFLGQSFRFREEDIFPSKSGLEDNFSDLVGRIFATPFKGLDLQYRFRFDNDSLDIRRHELDVRTGVPAFTLRTNYFFSEDISSSGRFGDREELNLRVDSKLTGHWRGFVSSKFDLEADSLRKAGIGLTYSDECFLIQTTFERDEFEDRELEPEYRFLVRLVFKHLGEFGNE